MPESKGVQWAVEQRRKQAIALRLAGVDLLTIMEQVNRVTPEEHHYSSATHVSVDLKRARERSRAELDSSVEDLRELQLERLERLLAATWPKAVKGDTRATDTAARLIQQMCKLKGLEAPTQVELSHRIEMESTAVAEAVLAAIEVLGLGPELRMRAMDAAQGRLLAIAAVPSAEEAT
jgi:hypothetical protein